MRYRAIILGFFIALAGCDHAALYEPVQNHLTAPVELAGQPSWFPIGPEVYQERDVDEAAHHVLALRTESRWFIGFAKQATKQEYGAYLNQLGKSGMKFSLEQPNNADGTYLIPNPPAYPKKLEELPLEDQGVRLALDTSASDDPAVVMFTLILSSADKPLGRELEHRWNNTLPFLFAFYVDGNAVAIPAKGFNKMGGANGLNRLVSKGEAKSWLVRVDAASLRCLLPDVRPHVLTIAAAFSNRQHEAHFDGQRVQPVEICESETIGGVPQRQILVRSNVAEVEWDGARWVPKRQPD